jgi:PEGA domain
MEKMKLLSGLLLGMSLVTTPVFAQPAGGAPGSGNAMEEAQLHFKRGAELYDEDNFRGALIEFQRAYEAAPSYKILFNIGQVEMELQNYAGALRAYTRYLREGGPDVSPARVTQVTQEIERLKGRVGEIIIETTAGAEVLIDEISVGFAPLPEPAAVNAGRHHVTVHLAGREPVSRVVDVAGQQQLTVALANDGVARPSSSSSSSIARKPAGSEERKPGSKVPMVVAWGVTGALAVTTGVLAVRAYSASSDLEDLRNTYPVTPEELSDQGDKQRSASLLADGFAAATLVAGGLSLYLTLTRDQGPELSGRSARGKSKLDFAVSPRGAFVTGSF